MAPNTAVDAPIEQCDQPPNDGSYGTCLPDCTLAPACGDGTVNITDVSAAGINFGLSEPIAW